MTRTKIVRTDRELECPELDEALRDLGDLVLLPDGIGEDQLAAEVSDTDLLLMCYTPVTSRIIESAQKLKGIVKYGVGIDAIDLDAARAKQIPVVNVPEYAEETVAESAFTLMLALAKKLASMNRAMDSEGWLWPTQRWLGSDVANKTVGLVGLGRIGRSMARMAGAGFRARVLSYDPNVTDKVMQDAGVERCESLVDMLPECDFVSIHCVLNGETKGLIGRRELQAMKDTAILINVSRGAIVDEAALLEALANGEIAGAGLDVYSDEPLARRGHPLSSLFDMPNVILLPHLAFYTKDAMQRLTEDTLDRCREALSGQSVLIKSADPRLHRQRHGVTFQR